MKDWFKNWKFWTVFGVIAALVIAAVVCHLKQPEVSYAWLEGVSSATFVLGFATGCICSKKFEKK